MWVQAGQEADEETQNWLDNMMSNTVATKASSGTGGDLVPNLGILRAPKPKPEDRAMRKTLIMRTGTSEVWQQPLAPSQMHIWGNALSESDTVGRPVHSVATAGTGHLMSDASWTVIQCASHAGCMSCAAFIF